MSAFKNPIGKGLSPERIDQGVDYGGSGPLYALGSGTVSNVYNSGWPGGTFLTIHLDSGQYIYYAEDIAPLVSVGQKVTAGQHIANATGGSSGIEVGWAAPPGTGESAAMAAGQASPTGDPGEVSTAFGELMSKLIASLGGPAGKAQGTISGSVPSSFGITPGTAPTSSATLTADTNPLSGILSFPSEITGFFKDAKVFVDALLWIVNPASWLRIGSFGIALILIVVGIYAFMSIGSDEPLFKMPQVVPVPV
jgi:murein DD-endopeptidase MepM/ murein hydrolase activator NlpD